MEDGIVEFINSQNKEQRDKLIEYLKAWNSKDIEEYALRRKSIGGKQFNAIAWSLHNTLMTGINKETIFKKLNDSQSQPT
jgi:hypothetical protein